MSTTETTTTTEAPLFYKTIDNDSRETHFNQSASDRSVWYIFTDDPYWIRRLDKVGELVRETGQGREYKVQANQVTVRAIPKRVEVSKERREALRQQMRKLRAEQLGRDIS